MVDRFLTGFIYFAFQKSPAFIFSMPESPTAVFEHSYYIGNYMSGILYGVELVMYFLTVQALQRKRSGQSNRRTRFLFIYSTILILLLTIDIAANAIWGEMMWITERDINAPGTGVAKWLEANVSVWYQAMGSSTVVAMIFMGDAMLIWRLFIIFGSNFWIIILPCVMYATAFVLAVIELVAAFSPGGNFFAGKTIEYGVPYYALTISTNLLVTLLICSRLLWISSKVKRALGKESAQPYTSIATLLVESALPYSLVGIMFLIPYAKQSDTAISFGQIWAKLACISPQLIILRVANEQAWHKDTMSRVEGSLAFYSDKEGSGLPYHSDGTTMTQGSRYGAESEKCI